MYRKYMSIQDIVKAHLMKIVIDEKDEEKAINLMWAMLQLQNEKQ